MKYAYFGQCSCGININKNNSPEETELDSNPSLILARTLTISTGDRISGHFTFSCCYDTTIFNFAYMNSPKNLGRDPESRSELHLTVWNEKITIAWNWRLNNKYAGNRSWRKSISNTESLPQADYYSWDVCPSPLSGYFQHGRQQKYLIHFGLSIFQIVTLSNRVALSITDCIFAVAHKLMPNVFRKSLYFQRKLMFVYFKIFYYHLN